MNKNRKTSHILNVFQYDETTGAVTFPSTLVLTAPASNDNSTKVGTTAWVRTYVTGLSYLTGNQSITISGDATGSGTTAITLTLANTAVTPGSYGSTTLVPVVTVDSKGRITSVTTAAISGSLTFTGDVTGTGTTGTSTGLTLAASGVTAGTYTKVTVDTKGRVTVGASATTSDISEGTNLYYTDARVLSYLTANTYATQSYVGTQISNLVAAAPATLDTLNELAAALGNDPSFATTVSTSIGTKVPQARTITINGTTYDLTANRSWTITSMIYPSAGIAVSTGSAWGTSITDNSANWNTAYGWGNHASGGYLTSATAATTYASLTGAYANPAFVASLAYSKITGVPAFLTSYTETDPYRVTSVAVSGTSTKTITITRADASTVTTTWTDIDTDTNTYATTLGFSGGTLTLTNNNATTVTVSLDGRYYLATNPSSYITLTSISGSTGISYNSTTGAISSTITQYTDALARAAHSFTAGSGAYNSTTGVITIPTNNNQLTNGAGYITGITSGNVTTALGFTPVTNARTITINGTGYDLSADRSWTITATLTDTLATVTARGATTSTAITTGVLTVNTGGTGTWGPFVVTSTSLWGDGATQYVTIGAGGAAGIMIYNPHIVWDSAQSYAAAKYGRSGGISSGAYYVAGTGASDNFFITKNGTVASPQLNINSSGNATFSGTVTASNLSGTNTGDQTNISGNAATAGGLAVHGGRNNEANKIVRTDGNGYIQAGYINSTSGNENNNSNADRVWGTNGSDDYLRTYRTSALSVGYAASAGNATTATNLTNFTAAYSSAPLNADSPSTLDAIGYVNSGTALFGQTDGGLYSSAYSTAWYHQIFGDFRTGQIAIRGKNAGTWQGWRTVVDSSNVANYTSGNTNSISSATGNAYYWSGIQYFETNNGGSAVNNSNSAKLEAYSSSNNSAFMSFHRGGYYAVNFGLDNDNYMRMGGWSAPANRFQLNMTSGDLTVAGFVRSSQNVYIDNNYGCTVTGVYASTRYQGIWNMGTSWYMPQDGTTPGNLYGLAWSHPNAGGQASYLATHGLLVMENGNTNSAISNGIWTRGDVTAYSDARVKENVEVITNAIERIKAIRGVTFTRNDREDKTTRFAGVIAQEVLAVLPEVVTEDALGTYSVAYGNLAGLFIEAIKEQQKEIDELKSLINGFTK